MKKRKTEQNHPYFIGIDLGGTGVTIRILDSEGRSYCRTQIPTMGDRGPDSATARWIESPKRVRNFSKNRGFPLVGSPCRSDNPPERWTWTAESSSVRLNLPSWRNIARYIGAGGLALQAWQEEQRHAKNTETRLRPLP